MGKDLEKPLNTPEFWHGRYTQQITWTNEARRYLFAQSDVKFSDNLLEVGCGTGALLDVLKHNGYTRLTGIDIDFSALTFIKRHQRLSCADGLVLPFPDNSFNHTMCHFTLMWVTNPKQMLKEMARVTVNGGWVFALAEPDYSNRVSYPLPLMRLADLQTASLEAQGATIRMGRILVSLFKKCGLVQVKKGIIRDKTTYDDQNALSGDLKVLRSDLAHVVRSDEVNPIIRAARTASRTEGAKWYVPIHFACGQVRK